jgi:hypothetical protein
MVAERSSLAKPVGGEDFLLVRVVFFGKVILNGNRGEKLHDDRVRNRMIAAELGLRANGIDAEWLACGTRAFA